MTRSHRGADIGRSGPSSDDASRRRWEDAPGLLGFFTTRRPQAHRHPLHRHRVRLLLRRRAAGAGDARPAGAAERQTCSGPAAYNQLFTMHGTTMIFLFNTPVLAGFGNYLLPLHDRRPRHGVPAAQRLQLLDLPVRRALHVQRASSSATRPTAAGSPTCRSPTRPYSPGINLDFWGLGVIFVGISTTVGAVNFIVTIVQAARAGHDRQPHADASCGRSSRWRSWSSSRSRRSRSSAALLERDRLVRHRRSSSPRRRRRARSCTSTCSGSGAIPRCTSCSCPAIGMVSMIIPVFSRQRAGRLPVGRRPRWSPSRSSASACGCTTCSPPALPALGDGLLLRRQPRHRHPERRPVLRVDRHDVGRRACGSPRRCCSPSASC